MAGPLGLNVAEASSRGSSYLAFLNGLLDIPTIPEYAPPTQGVALRLPPRRFALGLYVMALQAGEMTAELHFLTESQNAINNIDAFLWDWVGFCCGRLVCCLGVFWVGGGLELGSGLRISKLALVK